MRSSASNRMNNTLTECLPLNEIAKLRQRRWESQRRYLLEKSDFYIALWDQSQTPDRLEDLPLLPICDKAILRDSQAAHPPFGNYLAAPSEQIVRVHRTSGTSGQAMNVALTKFDSDQTVRVGARSHIAAGIKPGNRVIHCLNYQMWMGGFTDHLCVESAGATVIPFGVGNTRLLIQTILDLGADAIHCTPSYPAVMERTLHEFFPHIEPRDLNLKLGLFGGEIALDQPAFRQRLEDTWGFKARNANYGMADVYCNFASQCEFNQDLHFLATDVLHAELIHPQTQEPIPWLEGNSGELVLTHLSRLAQPLVRYRTNDSIVITGTDQCECGRMTPRFRILGRTDDVIIVRAVNVYPSAVAEAIGEISDLSGEYRIRMKGPGPYDRLNVEVELASDVESSDRLQEQVQNAIQFRTRASASVTLVPPFSLPRTEGKTKRLIREEE